MYYILGMGEYDRNANPLPLPVQVAVKTNPSEGNDDHDNDEDTAAADDEDKSSSSSGSIIKSYVQLPEGSIMRKGHQRVTIFIQQHATSDAVDRDGEDGIDISDCSSRSGGINGSSGDSSSSSRGKHPSGIIQDAYEIMIHKGEAYLIDVDVDLEDMDMGGLDDQNNNNNNNKQYRVIDQSSGWKHSLLLVEELL